MAAAPPMECGVRAALLFFLALGTLRASNYFVTVAGLGGTPEYEAQFKQWAAAMDKALRVNGADCRVETMAGATATRQAIRETLARVAREIKPGDAFALLLIGHGTYDSAEYKFNIPGPDITAEELASLLDRVPAGRQLVVNMTSASGASLPVLAKKNRVVITATKSGTEKNATVFARYWLDAVQNASADTDKNGTVSALEAFRYAQSKTAAYFQQEKLLATEHAMLDDTGSKTGVREVGPSAAGSGGDARQGLLAAAFPIIRPPGEAAAAQQNPAKQKLLAKKEQLEAAIDRLKYEKAAMPAGEYKKQLSALLLQLAKTQQEIDQ
jgi:hypothetical protein